uniref:Uncharacterized protein n=1 Tax=Arundo donax TaxID=35708 RepID=A0A0A9AU99_ARUDO
MLQLPGHHFFKPTVQYQFSIPS